MFQCGDNEIALKPWSSISRIQSQSEVMSCIKEIGLLNMIQGNFGAEGQLGLALEQVKSIIRVLPLIASPLMKYMSIYVATASTLVLGKGST